MRALSGDAFKCANLSQWLSFICSSRRRLLAFLLSHRSANAKLSGSQKAPGKLVVEYTIRFVKIRNGIYMRAALILPLTFSFFSETIASFTHLNMMLFV